MSKTMYEIVEEAKARRKSLLEDFQKNWEGKPDTTLRKFGKAHNLTGERVGVMLKKAREEANG